MTIPDTHQYTPVAVPTYGGDETIDEAIASLGESFIVTPVVDTPASEAQPYLEVVAPATLPEGYTFDAEANGHSFTVKVPVGGVEQGQKFSVPFPAGSNGYTGSAIPRASVPVGHWKDGLCDCFRLGVIHPAVWNAVCCPLILNAQVMHRLKLTWLGSEGTIAQTAATFRIFLIITVVFIFIDQILKYLPLTFKVDEYGRPTDGYVEVIQMRIFLNISFCIIAVILVAKVRKQVRSKYSIPEQNCKGCEDCCCALWCNCCTLSQMARHTADYESYAALCCSETGMPPHAPSIV
eukprot:CAMPEP_0172325708 /NCGR_PEP_ID=MMETSP1058-20130122/54564_1 /TAXON_ID=83371 /ORGANISM="Detonula confervacea, Strain CCMP 353" /LENGTH=292 /DNA_ID=CAMNT_0013042307 /DNA_START=26 /DNA_END=904 /DNA_ORIENTATION=+